MNSHSIPLDLPPLAAFALRWGRRLAVGTAVLLAALVGLELAAAHFLPRRSTRFLRDGTAHGQPAWIDNPFFSYRFSTARAARPPPPCVCHATVTKPMHKRHAGGVFGGHGPQMPGRSITKKGS